MYPCPSQVALSGVPGVLSVAYLPRVCPQGQISSPNLVFPLLSLLDVRNLRELSVRTFPRRSCPAGSAVREHGCLS